MNVEDIRSYCLAKPGVTECFPFNEWTLVFKVADKMFLLAGLNDAPLSINIKGDPETLVELRERYDAVTPGYHMNKKHWNTVVLDGSIPAKLLRQWIDDSYDCVVAALPKAKRAVLQG